MSGLVHISQVLEELTEDETLHPRVRDAIRQGIGAPWGKENEEPVEAPATITLEDDRGA